MRQLVVLLFLLSISGGTQAQNLGARQPAKGLAWFVPSLPHASRQGGDTLLDATIIAALPYDTTGTTTGYNDDYDEACPYSDSVSPDVVYAFRPDDDLIIGMDMLGSAYDTKIYIYDDGGALIACNDDFHPDYTSRLTEIPLTGGVEYYLVVDGYGGAHGQYQLSVTEFEPPPPCLVLPGCRAVYEEEPPLEDGYIDLHNGGCNSEEYGTPFTDLSGWEFAGTSGWYVGPDGGTTRDTDWLRITMFDSDVLEVEIESEQPVHLFQLTPTDCDGVSVFQQISVESCQRRTMYVTGEVGSEIWLWVGPQAFEAPTGFEGQEFRYRMSLGGELWPSCLELGPSSDYSYGCDQVILEPYYTSWDTGACHDDLDLFALCGDGVPTPGGDVMASVYLEAGGGVGITWRPYYYKDQPESRHWTCMTLAADLRTDSGSCPDIECLAGVNQFGGLNVEEAGWYWFIVDVSSEQNVGEWGMLYFVGLGTPPVPPVNNDCTGAEPLPNGSFEIHDDLTDATNRFDPGRNGCPGAPDAIFTSRDVVYEVSLAHGQTLDVTMTGSAGWDEVLYLVRDCEDPMDNCVAAGEYEDGGVHLKYTALDDELLWLVCDSYGLGPRPFTLTGSLDSTTDTPSAVPATLALHTAPNPFNPTTTLTFDLPRAAHARLRIYALDGRLVDTIVDAPREPGRHTVTWHARDRYGRTLASGSYLARLESAGEIRTTRLTLLK